MRKDALRAGEYTVVLIWIYLFLLVVPSGPTLHFFIPENKSLVESIRIIRQRVRLGRTWQQDNTIWFTAVVSCQFLRKYLIRESRSECTKKQITPGTTERVHDGVKVGFESAVDGSKSSGSVPPVALLLIQQERFQTGDKLRQSTHASICP